MNENELAQTKEINLRDLIINLVKSWRTLTGGALIGLLIAVASWYYQGYQAELTANAREGALDFVTWRTISGGLPFLANSLSQRQHPDPEAKRFYKKVSQPEWWQNNVIPVYKYSKDDVRNLGSVNQEALNAGTTAITQLKIHTSSLSREEALDDATRVEALVRQGAKYMALKTLLNRYDNDVKQVPPTLMQKMSKDEVDLIYLERKAENLESLRNDFPEQIGALTQPVMDPKDSGAKFLPLSTQILAAKTEINTVRESLTRSKDRLQQLSIVKAFLEKSLPLLDTEQSGFLIGTKLAAIEQEIRKTTDLSDVRNALALNTIAMDIENINSHYGRLFENDPAALVRRPALTLRAILGVIGGGFLGLLLLLARSLYIAAFKSDTPN